MCDFGYLALKVADSFTGPSPASHVARIGALVGIAPQAIAPSGYLRALTAGAEVVVTFYSGTCACDWTAERRRPLLELARRLGGARDVAWVKAGFWAIRGSQEDAKPRHAPTPVGWSELDAIALQKPWLVELRPPSGASTTLRRISS